MGRTLQELGETMSAEEFAMHLADDRLNPSGPERLDLAAGIVAATMANCHRGKDAEAFKPADFMPYAQPEQAPQEATAADFIGALNG